MYFIAHVINSTEKSHSTHIISELLETLIDANEIDLQLIEIEGDALLFFKFDDVPSRKEILSQVEKMYSAFHQHLNCMMRNGSVHVEHVKQQ